MPPGWRNTDVSVEYLLNLETIELAYQVWAKRVVLYDASGNVISLPSIATTATVTSVNDSDSNQTLLTADTSRKSFKVFNNSTAICYVKYGATASATDFTVRLNPYGTLEEAGYSGRVDAVWASNASGAALVTSMT